jgi:hypothetical protein
LNLTAAEVTIKEKRKKDKKEKEKEKEKENNQDRFLKGTFCCQGRT